jgi:hypothetical protein
VFPENGGGGQMGGANEHLRRMEVHSPLLTHPLFHNVSSSVSNMSSESPPLNYNQLVRTQLLNTLSTINHRRRRRRCFPRLHHYCRCCRCRLHNTSLPL